MVKSQLMFLIPLFLFLGSVSILCLDSCFSPDFIFCIVGLNLTFWFLVFDFLILWFTSDFKVFVLGLIPISRFCSWLDSDLKFGVWISSGTRVRSGFSSDFWVLYQFLDSILSLDCVFCEDFIFKSWWSQF